MQQASNKFKNLRKQTKESFKQQRKVEVLSAITSKAGDFQDYKVGSSLGTSNVNEQQFSTKQWNNGFLFKITLLLNISGFVEGYDIGIITFANLYY